MMRKLTVMIAVAALCAPALAGAASKTDKITESHRFADSGADNLLIVDNIWGDIEVRGYDGNEITVRAVKTIYAKDSDDIPKMEREVYLDITKDDDLLELYVDGPFRDNKDGSRRKRERWHRECEVHFDFEIKVPRGTSVELSTVNDGEIYVGDIDGHYDVHNINGGIEMEGIGGSGGDVYALNEDVTIEFAKNPTKDSRFGSLNGDVRLHFLPGLSADFYLKTFNGEFFSDFPVTYLPLRDESVSEKKKGRYVYRVNRKTAVRAGDGGPQIDLDMFNGDSFLLEKKL
jgi:hypothetical protein